MARKKMKKSTRTVLAVVGTLLVLALVAGVLATVLRDDGTMPAPEQDRFSVEIHEFKYYTDGGGVIVSEDKPLSFLAAGGTGPYEYALTVNPRCTVLYSVADEEGYHRLATVNPNLLFDVNMDPTTSVVTITPKGNLNECLSVLHNNKTVIVNYNDFSYQSEDLFLLSVRDADGTMINVGFQIEYFQNLILDRTEIVF